MQNLEIKIELKNLWMLEKKYCWSSQGTKSGAMDRTTMAEAATEAAVDTIVFAEGMLASENIFGIILGCNQNLRPAKVALQFAVLGSTGRLNSSFMEFQFFNDVEIKD